MIHAIVQNQNGILAMDLPVKPLVMRIKLNSMGIVRNPEEIPLGDTEDRIRVKLHGDSEVDRRLIVLLRETDTLADANLVAHRVSTAHRAIKAPLVQRILGNEFSSVQQLLEGIQQMTDTAGPVTESFFFPLTLRIAEDKDEEAYEIGASFLRYYIADVQEAIQRDRAKDLNNMARYYWDTNGAISQCVRAKLISADWTVEQRGQEVFGQVDVRLTEPLTEAEAESLKDWIAGQNSDGFGEDFEQSPIETEDGDLYISFWHSGDDYFVYTREEMENFLSQQSAQRMGGM